MVSQIKKGIDSGDLSASDLQEKLTSDFGDSAQGIVSADGTVDYDKLLELLQNNQPQPPAQSESGSNRTGGYSQRNSLESALIINATA